MIPESLHLRNFLSHRETDLDLRGIHVASLVGENGAGKSALLDAITWAVWGRSRAPYGRDDDLVYHGESDLEVEFVFRMPYQNGGNHRCRILRRREQRGRRSVSSILDFEVETPEGWRILTSDSIRETQQRIINHLGLDYETFINSAYLRQGHADEFTIQTSAQRKQVLSTILGLERWSRYQDQARIRLSDTQGRIKELDRRLDETEAEVARRPEYEAALLEADAQASQAETALNEVQAAVDELNRIREQAVGVRRQIEESIRRQEEVEAEQGKLQDETEAHHARLTYYQALVEQASTIEARHRAYQEALVEERAWGQKLSQAAKLQAEKAEHEAEIAAAREALNEELRAAEQEEIHLERTITAARTELERSLSEVMTQVALLAERFPSAELYADLQAAQESVTVLQTTAEELEEARNALGENEIAQSRLQERNRQLREMMAETKTRLDTLAEAEADCPLCGQPLSQDHHKRLLAEVEAQGKFMGDEFRTNRLQMSTLQEEEVALRRRIRDLDECLQARPTQEQALARLQQKIEEGEAAQKRAQTLEEQITTLRTQIAAEDYATAEHESLTQVALQKAQTQARLTSQDFAPEARAALADTLAQLSELGYDAEAHEQVKARVHELDQAEADYRELEKARIGVENEREALARLVSQEENLQARMADLTEARSAQEAVLATLEPQLARAPQLAQQLNAVRQEAATARQRVGAAKQNLAALTILEERLKTMREDRAKLAHRSAIYAELREAFGVNGIPAMIIEHMLPELERDANRILQQLTGGRMHVRFETQRETKAGDLRETLDIIISDEKGTRPYEGFSGGEKFRINFSIRVALSRMLAQRAGVRLRSLFVDEGFGALDADGRQRLVEAVKAVQDEFDMILVITHIDELREAFPTQIVVAKTDSGSQIEIV